MDHVWKNQLRNRITTQEQLAAWTTPNDSERAFFQQADSPFPLAITSYYLSLIEDNPRDPVRSQCVPRKEEFDIKPYELSDPLGEHHYSPMERVVHQYKNRLLVLVTDQCAVHCRHCFRRSFAGGNSGILSQELLDKLRVYIHKHEEIDELLLSGGDPLTLDDSPLENILRQFRETKKELVFRLATRVPVVLPQRVTKELIEMLKRYKPLWLITQFNHPREITSQSEEAVTRVVEAGIPILNQAVLLKGVNDDVSTLAQLSRLLVKNQIKPYYLFQGDLAPGTAHFRVPVERGMKLIEQLKELVSGIGMPIYALDLPDGGGKIPLCQSSLIKEVKGGYLFRRKMGKKYWYPKEVS